MKLMGEYGADAPETLRGAVAIAPPYDLTVCAAHLDRPALYIYRQWMLGRLRRKALAKLASFPGLADVRALRKAGTFLAFDDAYTAPIHGFKNAREYWERSSGIVYAPRIARDTVVISSLDDPFFPSGHVPEAELRKNPRIELVLTPGGGHVGFVSGSPLAPLYWAEELAAEILSRRVS
jgi:predicted alpha/beta-fold hydrolase